jgi:hypothetical protein
MRTPRTWTAVGVLCRSRAEALSKLKGFKENASTSENDWGLVSIKAPAGDRPAQISKIHLPPPPALLKRLEGLLLDREVRRTESGRQALRVVQAALKPRR